MKTNDANPTPFNRQEDSFEAVLDEVLSELTAKLQAYGVTLLRDPKQELLAAHSGRVNEEVEAALERIRAHLFTEEPDPLTSGEKLNHELHEAIDAELGKLSK